MGALHELTGGWTAALALLVVLAVFYCVALLARRGRSPAQGAAEHATTRRPHRERRVA